MTQRNLHVQETARGCVGGPHIVGAERDCVYCVLAQQVASADKWYATARRYREALERVVGEDRELFCNFCSAAEIAREALNA